MQVQEIQVIKSSQKSTKGDVNKFDMTIAKAVED